MSTQANEEEAQRGVRFTSEVDEMSPETSLQPIATLTGQDGRGRQELNPEAEQELKQLKTQLQHSVQSRRIQNYAFEPVSLPGSQPVSRMPSYTTSSSKRMPAGSAAPSPHHSPPHSAAHSPPLTPAVTGSQEAKAPGSVPFISQAQKSRVAADVMTPQRSQSPHNESTRPSAADVGDPHPKPGPKFSVGPSGDSLPASNEGSPTGTPGSTTPGTITPSGSHYTRPFTPAGDKDDPYARNKRQPPTRNIDTIDARFRFGNRDPRQGHSNSSSNITIQQNKFSNTNLGNLAAPSAVANVSGIKTPDEKRHSFFGGGKKHDNHDDSSTNLKDKNSSKGNLKRFFKFGGDHKHKDKRAHSPERGTRTPPNGSVPFADDHGLQTKYGKFGKILGSGAGGSVRLMKRTGDGKTFAVKQFRTRHAYESEREYNKKVTAEFCIGSTLHHGNIIETIDIVHEKGSWFEVMEYAPFDLFATVMTGKMGREEVTCCTLQILSGVTYLHSMGLAHRDLKLDNVVVNDRGIMKIIDFGSAVVFRYPFENDIVLATGVVGSDPYLAPEVYDNTRYDPQPADIWSIAIIYCCMCLRRFPWKAPRISDNSYRLFVAPPDPGQQALLDQSRRSSQNPSRNPSASEASASAPTSAPSSRPPSRPASRAASPAGDHGHHGHQRHHHHRDSETSPGNTTAGASDSAPAANPPATIKGPLRLLRLLPRDTRHIIGRMLELDPRKRATMDEILADPWIQNALVCRQEEDGTCYHAPNHTHTLEGGGAVSAPSKK